MAKPQEDAPGEPIHDHDDNTAYSLPASYRHPPRLCSGVKQGADDQLMHLWDRERHIRALGWAEIQRRARDWRRRRRDALPLLLSLLLLPLLLLPVLAPVLIGATRAFEAALAGVPTDGWPWCGLLAGLAVLYAVAGALAYGTLLEGS